MKWTGLDHVTVVWQRHLDTYWISMNKIHKINYLVAIILNTVGISVRYIFNGIFQK